VLASNHVYQLEVTLASPIGDIILGNNDQQRLIFQFIYHPGFSHIENYLMAFDLDVVQLCYNGQLFVHSRRDRSYVTVFQEILKNSDERCYEFPNICGVGLLFYIHISFPSNNFHYLPLPYATRQISFTISRLIISLVSTMTINICRNSF
jgi:hypothetical protein